MHTVKKRSQWVGVIGPTNPALMEEKAGLPSGTLKSAAFEFGRFLAKQRLGMVCVPVEGIPLWTLESYKRAGGKDSLALWPRPPDAAETSAAQNQGQPHLADRVRDDLTWAEEPFELARTSDCLVALGLSCGTMIEMAATKWIKNTPVLSVRSFMTGIPVEIAAELDLRYYGTLEALKNIIPDILTSLDPGRSVR